MSLNPPPPPPPPQKSGQNGGNRTTSVQNPQTAHFAGGVGRRECVDVWASLASK